MENQLTDIQDLKSTAATAYKNEIGMPLIALGLDLLPILIIFINSFLRGAMTSFVLLFAVISPIAGLITGIAALSRGKKRIGFAGKIISIISIVLPLSFVAFIILFFIGAITGVISFM